MPKSKDIQSILIMGLLAVIAAPVTAKVSDQDQVATQEHVTDQEDDPLGSFSVGPWQGRCIRDGWLGSANTEICAAELGSDSPVSINISRTFKGLTLTVVYVKCRRGLFETNMSQKELVAKDRAAKLEKLIKRSLKRGKDICRTDAVLPAQITTADLAYILTDTDGLEF
jgi:hypothetical protein